MSKRRIIREDITRRQLQQVWGKTNGRCWYCGERLEPFGGHPHNNFHIDHVVPISKGGLTELENLVPSCEYCNRAKRDMPLERFRRLRAWQASFFESERAGTRLLADDRFFGEVLQAERRAAGAKTA